MEYTGSKYAGDYKNGRYYSKILVFTNDTEREKSHSDNIIIENNSCCPKIGFKVFANLQYVLAEFALQPMLTNMQIKVFVIVYDDETNIRLVHTRMSLLNSILKVTGFAILKIKFGTRQKKERYQIY